MTDAPTWLGLPRLPVSLVRYRRRAAMVALVALVVDASVKIATVRWLDGRSVELPLLTLRSVRNSGVAFGIGADLPRGVVVAFTIIVLGFLLVAVQQRVLPSSTGAGLMVGGGMANVVDRIADGAVIDTFAVSGWPVFNVADVTLTSGVILTLMGVRRGGRQVAPLRGVAPRR